MNEGTGERGALIQREAHVTTVMAIGYYGELRGGSLMVGGAGLAEYGTHLTLH